MDKRKLEGNFTVKEGSEGQLFLTYEAGPGPMVTLKLDHIISLKGAHQIANELNASTVSLEIDLSYSSAAKSGLGPATE